MISWMPEAPSLSSKQAHMFMVLHLYTFSFTGFWFILVFTWCKNSLFHPRIQPKALPHQLCQLRDSVRVLLAFCNSPNSCFIMSELGSGWKVRQASVTYLDGKANLLPCSSTAKSLTATYALSLGPDVVRSPWDCPKLCQGPGLLPTLLGSPAPDNIWI